MHLSGLIMYQEDYDESYYVEFEPIPSHLVLTLKHLLRIRNVKTVLEVGFGKGDLLKDLERENMEVFGCDISKHAARVSNYILASATNLPFKSEHFDAVIAVSLIEHLSFREGNIFISETKKVLKNGGIIFLVTPNFWSPLRLIRGKKWSCYSDPTHQVFYTPFSLSKLIRRHHFKNIRFTFETNSFMAQDWHLPSLFKRTPKTIQYLINHLLISSPLALFRNSFWIYGEKEQ